MDHSFEGEAVDLSNDLNESDDLEDTANRDLQADMSDELNNDIEEQVHNDILEDMALEDVETLAGVQAADLSAYDDSIIEDELPEAFLQIEQDDMEEENVKVLRRDPDELMAIGMRNVEDILDVRRDDMLDKGMSENEIEEAIAREREELQQEFIKDAFPRRAADSPAYDSDEMEWSTIRDFAQSEDLEESMDALAQELSEETDELTEETPSAFDGISNESEVTFEDATKLIKDTSDGDETPAQDVAAETEAIQHETEDAIELAKDILDKDETLAQDVLTEMEGVQHETEDDPDGVDELPEENLETNQEISEEEIEQLKGEWRPEEEISEDVAELAEDAQEENDLSEIKKDLMREVVRQNVLDVRVPSKQGTWTDTDQIGNSMWVPDDDAEFKWQMNGETKSMTGREFRELYGVDGVVYKDGEPDFEPFEDDVLGHVELDQMPDHRQGSEGSYEAATRQAALKLDISEGDVRRWMEEQDLTWHECGDRTTVRAIPTGINMAFAHTGGISIQRGVEAIANEIHDRYGEVALRHDGLSGAVHGIDSAAKARRQYYRDRKKNL